MTAPSNAPPNQAKNVCVMCGKSKDLTGNLHPAYPEVRNHWLKIARECIDAGIDGVNFRIGTLPDGIE